MAEPPTIDVTTRQDGGAAWRICSGGICVIAATIPRAQAILGALCRSRGIEAPQWPSAEHPAPTAAGAIGQPAGIEVSE